MNVTPSCPDCTAASFRQHHGYTADCTGCRARAVARSMSFLAALKAGRQDRLYRRVLEQCRVTHAEVVAAAKSDRACDRLMSKRQEE